MGERNIKNNLLFFAILYSNEKGNCTKSKYTNHRSGSYIPKGKSLRWIKKTQGTNKIDGFCPASVLVSSKHETYRGAV